MLHHRILEFAVFSARQLKACMSPATSSMQAESWDCKCASDGLTEPFYGRCRYQNAGGGRDFPSLKVCHIRQKQDRSMLRWKRDRLAIDWLEVAGVARDHRSMDRTKTLPERWFRRHPQQPKEDLAVYPVDGGAKRSRSSKHSTDSHVSGLPSGSFSECQTRPRVQQIGMLISVEAAGHATVGAGILNMADKIEIGRWAGTSEILKFDILVSGMMKTYLNDAGTPSTAAILGETFPPGMPRRNWIPPPECRLVYRITGAALVRQLTDRVDNISSANRLECSHSEATVQWRTCRPARTSIVDARTVST